MLKQFIKISLTLLPYLVYGQAYNTDVAVVATNMAALKNYSVKIRYSLYLDNNMESAFQQSTKEIRKKDENLFFKRSDGQEFLNNKNYRISVDDELKEINAFKNSIEEVQAIQDPGTFSGQDIDLLTGKYDKIKILNASDEKITYQLTFRHYAIESMVVVINRQKKIFELVRYVYADPIEIAELKNTKHKVILEITYEDFKANAVADNIPFNESKYILMRNGKLKPAAKYSDYKLNILN